MLGLCVEWPRVRGKGPSGAASLRGLVPSMPMGGLVLVLGSPPSWGLASGLEFSCCPWARGLLAFFASGLVLRASPPGIHPLGLGLRLTSLRGDPSRGTGLNRASWHWSHWWLLGSGLRYAAWLVTSWFAGARLGWPSGDGDRQLCLGLLLVLGGEGDVHAGFLSGRCVAWRVLGITGLWLSDGLVRGLAGGRGSAGILCLVASWDGSVGRCDAGFCSRA